MFTSRGGAHDRTRAMPSAKLCLERSSKVSATLGNWTEWRCKGAELAFVTKGRLVVEQI